MALRAGYKGIKKYVADMLNKMNPGDSFATDAEIATKVDISALGTQEGATASKLYHPHGSQDLHVHFLVLFLCLQRYQTIFSERM